MVNVKYAIAGEGVVDFIEREQIELVCVEVAAERACVCGRGGQEAVLVALGLEVVLIAVEHKIVVVLEHELVQVVDEI